MSNPKVPPGLDHSGVPLIGTAAYTILDRTLTLDHSRQPTPPQAFDRGFQGAPGVAPALPWAVSATWMYASMAMGLQQQQIDHLGQVLARQQAQLDQLLGFTASIAQELQSVIDTMDQDSDVLASVRDDLQELHDSIIVVRDNAPASAQEVSNNRQKKN